MTGMEVLWLVVLAGAVFALGVLMGWIARGAREHTIRLVEEQLRDLGRRRIQHDTKRASVARPGTRPGRVARATIDMGASNMHQHSRELD